jgi:PAS domain S-box-containing protein
MIAKAKKHFNSIFKNLPIGVCLANLEGKILATNRAMCRITGFSKSELFKIGLESIHRYFFSGKSFLEALHEEGYVWGVEREIKRKNGTPCYVSFNAVRFNLSGLAMALVFAEDITKQKRIRDDLENSRERLRILFEYAPDAYYLNDLKGNFLDGNKAAEELIGYSRKKLIGKNLFRLNILPQDQIPRAQALLKKNVMGKPTGPDEFTLRRKDGTNVHVEIRSYPVQIQGEASVLGIARDISSRKRAELALMESEEKYRKIVEASPDGVTTTDLDGHITFASPRTLELHGYENAGKLLGRSAFDLIASEERKKARRNLRKVYKEGIIRDVEYVLLRKDESRFSGELSSALIRDNMGEPKGFVAIVKDISERKQIEREHVLLWRAIEQASELIIVTKNDNSIEYVNPAIEKVMGFSEEEVLGKSVKKIFRIQDKSFFARLKQISQGCDLYVDNVTAMKKNGHGCKLEISVSPVRDEKGTIFRYVYIVRDITQEEKIRERLRRAEKMEALGTLAGGIAHDFNNLLSSIIGYTDLSMDDVSKNSLLHSNLQEVLRAARSGKDLVKQILSFSRQDEEEKKAVRLSRVVKETLKFLRPAIPTNVKIRQNLESDSAVMANPVQIQQVIINLCNNAVQAMSEKGGILQVNLRDIESDEDFRLSHPEITPGPFIRLTVSDTGHGIKDSIMESIFDPFFTTKEKNVGTGLGLAVVHGIVRSLGGNIFVYSKPRKGTTFQVFLPRIKSPGASENHKKKSLIGKNKFILFVDDEIQIVRLAEQLLKRRGYKVSGWTNAQKALEVFQAAPENFNLAIVDMSMPKVTGDELAKRIKEIRPDIPIILCTGINAHVGDKKASYSGIEQVITKPWLNREFVKAVRRALVRKKGGLKNEPDIGHR